MSLRFAPLASVVAALPVLVGAPGPRASEHLTAPTAEAAEADALLAALAAPWTGDLDGMIERGFVRVGVSHAPLFFTCDGADQSGLNVDLAAAFEAHLRETLGPTARHLTVVLAPLPRDRMLPALIEGRVDLLNANLTVTPAREAPVDFGDPFRGDAREIVVSGPAAGDVATLDDLAAVGLHVRRSGSCFDHVAALNVRRVAEGLAPIAVAEADERLEDHDLLELVDAGVIPAIIVDEAKVGIMQVLPATAGDPNVRIPDIHIAERNVEAGVKCLDFLRRRCLDDPAISEFGRAMMSFAACNMGPGNLAKSRRRAEAMGLDPNVWFGNVEIAADRAVSREPVTYVRDILKCHVTCELFERRAAERGG